MELRQPDASTYWTGMVKCRSACPVNTDACGYVTAIAEGRDEDAYRIARATNPFASICGRVCGAPCEANCRRGSVDAPVAIRALKRFVTDQFGPESRALDAHRNGCDVRMLPPGAAHGERIAVVGAGVSGLTVAHDLIRVGYRVTVFEANAAPGGMLTVGVPIFRLPRDLVQREIEAILSLGVDLRCNQRLGRDFTIASLRADGYQAIFLGIGLPKGRRLPIAGADLPGVYDGLEFLKTFNEGQPLPMGRRVVVIGGGNVAYDVARSALRLAYDAARSALRMSSDKEVHVVCLEQRTEMPADEREVDEGADEGITLHNGWGPQAIVDRGRDGLVLRVVKCTSVFGADGRFNPTFDERETADIECDTILFAIGQSSDLSFLSADDGVESERGLIKVDRETYQTTAPDVFACGDIAHGPRLFIDAIASAQIAARSMHDYLRVTRTDVVVRQRWTPASYAMAPNWEVLQRREPPVVDADERRTSVVQIELAFPHDLARQQASRCLRCNVNTVFDTSICIACAGCVDVCPNNLLKLVGLGNLDHGSKWQSLASEALGIPLDTLLTARADDLNALGAVMLKDEDTCIRCGMCAARCPTHAVTMRRFDAYRECIAVDTPNPKIRYTRAGA